MAEPQISFDTGPVTGGTLFRAPERLIVANSLANVAPAFDEIVAAQAAGKWLAGYASYELGYALLPRLRGSIPKNRDTPLILFGVFDAPEALMPRKTSAGALSNPCPMWDRVRYSQSFDAVKRYIGAGDCYQINLTFPMSAEITGAADAVYAQLRARQPVLHGAFVDLGVGPKILSRSPELFFRTNADGRIETRPMKGTVARGLTEEEDAARKSWLQNDEKNRAENLMIVDLLRNDISQVADIGSVRVSELFNVESYATVHQMVSSVQADLRQGTGLPDIFTALFPCGSITGAPKLRAMEIIREQEETPRGVYCGAIGWAAPDGRSSFSVAIRTLSLFDDGQVRLNVGGGVVWDSTAPSEYEEALLKARYAMMT